MTQAFGPVPPRCRGRGCREASPLRSSAVISWTTVCQPASPSPTVKSIPVLDAESGRAKFVGAPPRYQMPISVLAATVEERRELNASLILDKQGIVRIEFHANGNC